MPWIPDGKGGWMWSNGEWGVSDPADRDMTRQTPPSGPLQWGSLAGETVVQPPVAAPAATEPPLAASHAVAQGDEPPMEASHVPAEDTGPLRIFQDETGAIKSSGSFSRPGASLPVGQAGPSAPTAGQIMGAHDFNSRPASGGGFASSGDPVLDAMQRLAADYMTPKDMSSTLSTATKGPNGTYTYQDRLNAEGKPMRIGDENFVAPEDFARGLALTRQIGEGENRKDYRRAQEGELAARTKLYEAQAGQTASGQGKGGYRGSKSFADIQEATRIIEDAGRELIAAQRDPLARLDPKNAQAITLKGMFLNQARSAAMRGDLEAARQAMERFGAVGVDAGSMATATEANPPPGAQPSGGTAAAFTAKVRAGGR